MLKYIKRQTSRRRSSSHEADADVDNVEEGDEKGVAHPKRNSLRSTTSFCDEILMEEEDGSVGEADKVSLLTMRDDEDIFKYQSRLSMSLAAIVSEPNCLSYFVQYLETRQALPLIKFYLDIENFKLAALLEEEIPSQPNHAPLEEDDNDVPELKTLCDLSMRKPLTDDEKSRIYAETNKQINKQRLSLASINDAIAIYQKYLINHLVELPIVILAHISLLLCGKDKASQAKPIPASCFDEAREYVLTQLERDHLMGFLQSSYYSKYCLELLEDQNINIYDVLYSELALFYFTEYLEQHQERECLEFWITAINFRKSYTDQKAAQADAMIIYDKYFSLQAEGRLWMSQKLRSRVEQAICAPAELEQAFDLALLLTAKYLEQKYFQDFLKSHIFDNYVNELKVKTVTTEQITPATPSLRHKPKMCASQQRHRKALSMSDCSHISQHNTLLASMDNSKTSNNMNIDSRQLTNPQLLWQRPGGALKFGHVNSLGRYERDFEAVDGLAIKSAQPWSQIKNAMRKWVKLPEDNVQEEIAWQVAEMIVKDVTNITLKGKEAAITP